MGYIRSIPNVLPYGVMSSLLFAGTDRMERSSGREGRESVKKRERSALYMRKRNILIIKKLLLSYVPYGNLRSEKAFEFFSFTERSRGRVGVRK